MRRLLVVALAVLAFPTAAARAADTYAVDTCATASGGSATTVGWRFGSAKHVGQTFDCPSRGVILSRAEVVPGDSSQAEMFLEPPAGTQIAGVRVWRTLALSEGWESTIYAGRAIEQCAAACPGTATRIDGPPDVSATGLDAAYVTLAVYCRSGGCTAGDAPLQTVRRLQVDVTDDSDPTFNGVPSGDLLQSGAPVAGVRTVSFSAADTGSGVFQAFLEVDGARVAGANVDANGGKCGKPFTDFAPCRSSASGSLSFDTATLLDGPHSMRLVVTDATETNTVAYGPVQVTTSNQSLACGTAVSPALGARFATTRKATLTRKGGGAFTLEGNAPAGAALTLQALEARTGAAWTPVATGVAGADGGFRLTVPAGPSRSLRVALRASPLARELSCSNVLQVKVPARVTLTAKRSAARRYRIGGRLLGGFVPARGKLVELQAYERGRWRTFGSARSGASGRYAYTYRFRAESVGRRFRLRARVRADAAYPFSLGYSKVVRVRVR